MRFRGMLNSPEGIRGIMEEQNIRHDSPNHAAGADGDATCFELTFNAKDRIGLGLRLAQRVQKPGPNSQTQLAQWHGSSSGMEECRCATAAPT